jgi:hypothetical protein
MKMVVRSMETAETAMEMAPGALPRPGRVPEQTSVPRNSSAATAELRNCSGKNADSSRVFHPEALYRQRGVVKGLPGLPHT